MIFDSFRPKFLITLIVFTLFVVLDGIECSGQSPKPSGCKLTGTISDLQDAIVPGAKLFFLNSFTSKTTIVDLNGEYSINLPIGTYEVSLRWGIEFSNYKRAKVDVSCIDEVRLNVFMLPQCVSYGCSKLGFDFDVFSGQKDFEYNLVIAYADKKKKGNVAVYQNAMLTYKGYSVRAKEIMHNSKTHNISVHKGWIENGKTRETFDELTIDFAQEILSGKAVIRTVRDYQNFRSLNKLNNSSLHR